MNKFVLISTAVVFSWTATAALAADLFTPEQVPQPPITESESDDSRDWSGFYVGLHGGYGWGHTGAVDIPDGGGVAWVMPYGQFDADSHGLLGGIQAGYNWQKDAFVLGVEGDLGWLAVSGSGAYAQSLATANPTDVITDGGPYATLRGRAGVAVDNLLIFATGGLMVADLNSRVESQNGVLVTNDTGWQLGWTVGAGAEVAVNKNWSLKFDYLYYDLGSERVSGNVGGVDHAFEIDHTGHLLRAGLNYRF